FASAFRPERVCAEPQNMIFPNSFNTMMPPPQVMVENYGKTPVKVLSATVEDSQLQAKVNEVGGKYQVQVSAPNGYVLPSPTKLVIKTDDAQIPTITVPVYTIKPQAGLAPLPPKAAPTNVATQTPILAKAPAATQPVKPMTATPQSTGG